MNIIIKPLITEKAMKEAAVGRYTFAVAIRANKIQIAGEVAELFKVHPVKVTTLIVKGRRTRFGKRREEKKVNAWKKAVVEVAKGQKIALFDVQGGPANA